MGSGLILLVIVGAWLAVLVPMALKSHDSASSLRSADRFSDAMRVLSRKGTRDVLVPRRSTASLVVSATRSERAVPTAKPLVEDSEDSEDSADSETPVVHARRTAAERRLRSLLVLLGLALVTLGLALYGLPAALIAHLVCDGLLILFVVHLRRQALLRARRTPRPVRQPVRRPAAQSGSARRPARIAGIPDRMPAPPAPLSAPLPAPAARYEDKPLPSTGTDGTWSPVPVPPPTYARTGAQAHPGAARRAPKSQPRVLDLTKPGQWSAALEGDDAGLAIFDEGPDLDDILSRRKAVNGW